MLKLYWMYLNTADRKLLDKLNRTAIFNSCENFRDYNSLPRSNHNFLDFIISGNVIIIIMACCVLHNIAR